MFGIHCAHVRKSKVHAGIFQLNKAQLALQSTIVRLNPSSPVTLISLDLLLRSQPRPPILARDIFLGEHFIVSGSPSPRCHTPPNRCHPSP